MNLSGTMLMNGVQKEYASIHRKTYANRSIIVKIICTLHKSKCTINVTD